jgi:HK97 family phage portal protein
LWFAGIDKDMKWFKNIFKRSLENPAISINSPEAYEMFGLPTAAGVPVSYRLCMGHPGIRRAVALVSGYIGRTPFNVIKQTRDNSNTIDYAHVAYQLLNKRPCNLYTPSVFKRQMQAYLMLFSNGIAYIVRDEYARPLDLLILDPEQTWVRFDGNHPEYHTRMNDKGWVIQPEDIFHIKDFGDGVVGDSLVRIARDALGGSLALARYTETFFRNNCAPKVYVELPPAVKDREKLNQFIAEWRSNHSGSDSQHKAGFIPQGTKITAIPIDNQESQFNETRETDLIQIADLLGLPPHKLGAKISSSYNSLESENEAFLADCLSPWIKLWEEEIETKLLTESEKARNTRWIEADTTQLVPIDAKTQNDIKVSKLNNGLISWEEYRISENLSTNKDLEEEWRIPTNITIVGEPVEIEEVPQPTADTPAAEAMPPVKAPGAVQEKNVLEGADMENDSGTARQLTTQILGRLIKRLEKSVCEGKKTELEIHRSVFLDHFNIFPDAENFVDNLLIRLQTEIDATLPEQYKAIFSRLDPSKEIEALWTK